MGTAITLLVFAVVALITLAVRAYYMTPNLEDDDLLDWFLPLRLIVFSAIPILLALASAGLLLAGRDVGRALGFTFCGYELLGGCSGLVSNLVFAAQSGNVRFLQVLDMLATALMMGIALVAFVLLFTRSLRKFVSS